MIKIEIATDGKEIYDHIDEEKVTLKECALVVYRLEEIKKYLLEKEFDSKFEVREGKFAEEEDGRE